MGTWFKCVSTGPSSSSLGTHKFSRPQNSAAFPSVMFVSVNTQSYATPDCTGPVHAASPSVINRITFLGPKKIGSESVDKLEIVRFASCDACPPEAEGGFKQVIAIRADGKLYSAGPGAARDAQGYPEMLDLYGATKQ